jgi:hypothetical protein
MDVQIKIMGRDDVRDADRETVNVETHGRRGDDFVVMKADQVLENDEVVFRVPDGGRLILTMPVGGSEIVYDPAQGAAVRKDAQNNAEGKADDPRTGEQRQAAELAGRRPVVDKSEAPANQTGSVKANLGPGGLTPVGQPRPTPGQPQMRANQPQQSRVQTPPQTPEQKAKADEIEKAKQFQQSGAGRPAGEKPSAPGSTVGSPPSGNEGNK